MIVDLYRFYGTSDRLLYIGISLSAVHRAKEHRATQIWWPDVARMEVEHLDVSSRAEAEAIERAAIGAERPVHNVTHSRYGFSSERLREGPDQAAWWMAGRDALASLSFEAEGMWHIVNLYCAGVGNEGRLAKDRLHLAVARKIGRLRASRIAAELVAAGLWIDHGSEYELVHWFNARPPEVGPDG